MSIVQTRQPPPAQPFCCRRAVVLKGGTVVFVFTRCSHSERAAGHERPCRSMARRSLRCLLNRAAPSSIRIQASQSPNRAIDPKPTDRPKFDPNTGQPIAQPSGPKFDPNTGQPIPKFDGETGKQNW